MGFEFPHDYRASRAAFVQACRDRGARLEAHTHPRLGSDGAPVATDVAAFGAPDADRVLILVSGTHGVEGLCGAGIQQALIAHRLGRAPDQLRIVLVHALNPHGFLDLHRTDESNIDLNRNFLDHARTSPDDSAYAEVHPFLVPETWEGPERIAADAALAHYVETRGAGALQAAVSGGQYSFADGLFYGGRAPAWSNGAWRDILRTHAARVRELAVIDLHSGLGARGACELISGAVQDSGEHRLAQQYFGDKIVFPGATSTAPAAVGYMGASIADALPGVRGALVVAEFGTVSFAEVFAALRIDNWFRSRGSPTAARTREIRAQMDCAFVGRDRGWQTDVVEHAFDVFDRTLAGLSGAGEPGAARARPEALQ
jgi:hypothetical protein